MSTAVDSYPLDQEHSLLLAVGIMLDAKGRGAKVEGSSIDPDIVSSSPMSYSERLFLYTS